MPFSFMVRRERLSLPLNSNAMKNRVRVRFAPSPTGPLHIGGVRTALYNYLFAKRNGGDFILRIEDTDQNRYVAGSEEYITESLAWFGLHCDEGPLVGGAYGPYRQSERKEQYREFAETLVKKGMAYYAFDSQQSLEEQRAAFESQGKTFSYNWANRESLRNALSLTEAEVISRLERGDEYVIRFKSPANEILVMNDLIRGQLNIDTSVLDDKVLFKSDGMPTYHLANIVDDHLMEITHVIRGEEWLPSLALHRQLYDAFGWDPPQFAHLPLLMKPVGKGKLSKRDGDKLGFPVYPLQWGASSGYRESGYFPEAVINFLALLGWNPGTEQELFSMDQLIAAFSLERVHKAGARFDPDKIKWYNHQYLQKKSTLELAKLVQPLVLEQLGALSSRSTSVPVIDLAYIEKAVHLLKERATFVKDLWEMGVYFYIPPGTFDEKALKKHWKEDSPKLLSKVKDVIEKTDDFSSDCLEKTVKQWINEQGVSFGKIMPPLRIVLVGGLTGPHLFDIMSLLGKEATVGRIATALQLLRVN